MRKHAKNRGLAAAVRCGKPLLSACCAGVTLQAAENKQLSRCVENKGLSRRRVKRCARFVGACARKKVTLHFKASTLHFENRFWDLALGCVLGSPGDML